MCDGDIENLTLTYRW